jgi:hypothetical protein
MIGWPATAGEMDNWEPLPQRKLNQQNRKKEPL